LNSFILEAREGGGEDEIGGCYLRLFVGHPGKQGGKVIVRDTWGIHPVGRALRFLKACSIPIRKKGKFFWIIDFYKGSDSYKNGV